MLLDARGRSHVGGLTRGRRRREVGRGQRDRGVDSRHTANACVLGDRRRCVLVRVGADDDITTIGGGTDGLELVRDEVGHRFAQPTQLLGSERRYRTGPLRRHTHLDSHRHGLKSEALRPVDEIRRYAQSHRVPEFSQLERQSECGLHIAPCSDSRQQCAHDLLLDSVGTGRRSWLPAKDDALSVARVRPTATHHQRRVNLHRAPSGACEVRQLRR